VSHQQRYFSLGLVLLSICSVLFIVRGYISETHTLHSRDFKPVYAASRCLLAGCNPYDIAATKQEYLGAGGTMEDNLAFQPHNSTYPPGTFFLILPVAWLPWSWADAVWLALIAIAMVMAAFLVADLCQPYAAWPAILCIGASLLTCRILLMLGQPAGVAIGFCVIGSWCLLKRRYEVAGVICFAINLACKPQIAALVWVYFFFASRQYRRRSIQIAILTAAICLPGILWVSLMRSSVHWMRDVHANLTYMVARGNPADPGPADMDAPLFENLQSAVSVFRDEPHFYNPIVWAITGSALLAWFYLVIRMKSSIEKDFLAIASAVCFTMLPVYHRSYDVYLFLLSFPALALLFSRRRLAGTVAFVLSLLLIIFTSTTYTHFFQVRYTEKQAHLSIAQTLALGRNVPITLFALGLLYLVQFFRLRDSLREQPVTSTHPSLEVHPSS